MKVDVSKLIMESLDEIPSKTDVVTESVEGSMQAAKRSGKAFTDIFRGGSSQDEAEAAKQYSEEAAKKLGEGQPESIVAKEYLKQVGKKASAAAKSEALKEKTEFLTSGAKKAATAAGAASEAAGEQVKSASGKIMSAAKEHPGITGALAAALAAGVGALALRKKMKKTKQ